MTFEEFYAEYTKNLPSFRGFINKQDMLVAWLAAYKVALQSKLPDVEITASKVHEAWIESKLKAGINSRKLETGEELMVPYEQLSEQAKDLDRTTVITVYNAINTL